MGMLLHNTLMEQEAAQRKALAEKKPVEVPKETKEPEAEPVKKTGGRRKTSK